MPRSAKWAPASSNSSEACSRAFEGMQPILRQVPPKVGPFLDHGDLHPELGGADGADIAARAGADDREIECIRHDNLWPRRAFAASDIANRADVRHPARRTRRLHRATPGQFAHPAKSKASLGGGLHVVGQCEIRVEQRGPKVGEENLLRRLGVFGGDELDTAVAQFVDEAFPVFAEAGVVVAPDAESADRPRGAVAPLDLALEDGAIGQMEFEIVGFAQRAVRSAWLESGSRSRTPCRRRSRWRGCSRRRRPGRGQAREGRRRGLSFGAPGEGEDVEGDDSRGTVTWGRRCTRDRRQSGGRGPGAAGSRPRLRARRSPARRRRRQCLPRDCSPGNRGWPRRSTAALRGTRSACCRVQR